MDEDKCISATHKNDSLLWYKKVKDVCTQYQNWGKFSIFTLAEEKLIPFYDNNYCRINFINRD